MYKNIFFFLALCTFIGNVSASDVNKEASLDVASEAEQEQLEQLLKIIDSEEFIEGFLKGMKEGIKEAEGAGLESSKIAAAAEVKTESTKVAANALIKAAENFGIEAAKITAEEKKEVAKTIVEGINKLKPMLYVLMFLSIAKTITSTLNR